MQKTLEKPERKTLPYILVVGLGDWQLQDDGVGIHAAKKYQPLAPRGVQVVEVGNGVLDALYLFERADKILVLDAIQAGGPPGTLYRIELNEREEPAVRRSLHEASLISVLRLLRRNRQPQVVILGVEPDKIEFGLRLTPPVAATLPWLLEEIHSLVKKWQQEGCSAPAPAFAQSAQSAQSAL